MTSCWAAGARHGQAVAAAVVVDGPAEDHAVHRVAVGERHRERPEARPARRPLAADVTVRAAVEGVAAPVGGQRAEAADGVGRPGEQVQVDAARPGPGRSRPGAGSRTPAPPPPATTTARCPA